MRDKTKVHEFYNKMRRSIKTKEPNPAHLALTRLQQEYTKKYPGSSVVIVTQNIDDLHEKAKSENVIHMHGELNSIWCEHCDARYRFLEDSSTETKCNLCGSKKLRPDIVWFGEMPYFMEEIDSCLSRGSLFLSIGTSGVVYPAAGFVRTVNRLGYPSVEFNLTPSLQNSSFTYSVYGKAGVTVPDFVSRLLESGSIDFLKKQS